jgi:hypothetical protein
LPDEFAVDFDRTADMLGPYGEDPYKRSVVKKGKCSIDSAFFGESDVYKLGQSLIETFNNAIEGHFMWTFRNELEPRWNYITAYDNGWIKNGGREEVIEEPAKPCSTDLKWLMRCTDNTLDYCDG